MIKEGSNNGDQDHVRLEKKEKMISSDSGLPSLPKADNLLIEKERLSVCLITKNEERNIKLCLDSLVGVTPNVVFGKILEKRLNVDLEKIRNK